MWDQVILFRFCFLHSYPQSGTCLCGWRIFQTCISSWRSKMTIIKQTKYYPHSSANGGKAFFSAWNGVKRGKNFEIFSQRYSRKSAGEYLCTFYILNIKSPSDIQAEVFYYLLLSSDSNVKQLLLPIDQELLK